MDEATKKHDEIEFSLFTGGFLYQIYLWTHLVKKPLLLYKRRIIVVCLFAWLPLFLMTIFNDNPKVAFSQTIDIHIRLLIALSLLIFAEVIANDRLQVVVRHFMKGDLISLADREKFKAVVSSAISWENSWLVEFLLIVFVVALGYVTKVNISGNSLAENWYKFVSLPLFQFMLLRWYYRLVIWYRFLWQVSKLRLQINSLHPDGAGGLGFLSYSVYAFALLLLANSVLMAGLILDRLWNEGAMLSQFHHEIISTMMLLMMLPLFPLLFFTASLVDHKRFGTLDYDVVAKRYVNDFRKKRILPIQNNSDGRLNEDIQTLADLSNSFKVSNQMRITPFGWESVLFNIILIAIPFLFLLLAIMPFEKVMKQLIGILF